MKEFEFDNFFYEAIITIALMMLYSVCCNDPIVVYLMTLETRLVIAVRDVHITIEYLYGELFFALLATSSIFIANIYPNLALVINKICPIMITYFYKSTITENEYQEWLSFIKRVVVTANNNVIICVE